MTRDRALFILDEMPEWNDDCRYSEKECEEVIEFCKSLLSIPEREKGKWIRFQSNEFQPWHIVCSNCGQYWSIDDHAEIFKYCFNCGADMRNNNNDNH